MDVVWDMETNDPDDFLTLLFLLGHPGVHLKAVTITPGSRHQVGLVRWALAQFGVDIPVGAGRLDHPKVCVSGWHYKAYGEIGPSEAAEEASEVLRRSCDAETTLITGAPLNNLGRAMASGITIGRWVAQGGFAGEGVVPRERQLEKFRGLTTCPTFNFNGEPRAALRALSYEGIGERWLVSKNVCHGVRYDRAMHFRMKPKASASRSLALIHQGMEVYLRKRSGKALHDPLAAACAIDPEIGQWAEVEVYRERGGWGSRRSPGSGVKIITGYDHERFIQTLTAT